MLRLPFCLMTVSVLSVDLAHAQVANGTSLSLFGATSTFSLTPGMFGSFASLAGEQPWYGSAQLPPQPFTAPGLGIAYGLPPNAAWPAIGLSGGLPYWSSYGGEYEAYPNLDAANDLGAIGALLPIATTRWAINLTAFPMPSKVAATLPSNISGRTYLSGAFNTYPYSQEYGYFEMTARLPSGQSEFPAFWLVPVNMNGPPDDIEIDVMECYGVATSYATTLHSNTLSGGASGQTITPGVDLSQAYHRYGVDWEASTITFYLDGVSVFSLPTPSDMHQPMFIIANLAIGGPEGAPTGSTPTNGTFSIAAINVWQRPGN